MTIADDARNSALHFEAVKFAYRQNREGIVVSFVVHPSDIPSALSTSSIGARYMVALVELDDNEQPKPQPAKEPIKSTAPLPQPEPQSAGAKRGWEEFEPAQQAGMRGHDPRFAVFLEEEYLEEWREHQDAAECIRAVCGVRSRSEFSTNHAKRVLWCQLDKHFQAWLAKERVGS